jgi:ATP-dependent helicase/nuclease subunit B
VAERATPNVYSIAAHRGFADALVAGLLPRYAEGDLGLARLTLLLPSARSVRTVTEAFIRISGDGLLMPRMVAVGDLDLDETLGPLLDPLGAGAEIPPAADMTLRWLKLAQIIREVRGDKAPRGNALLGLAFEMGRAMDRLLVEDIGPEELVDQKVVDLLGDLSGHWLENLKLFVAVQDRWLAQLVATGEVDPADRRNRLFRHARKRWRENPPATPIVAAGVTAAAPALARLLRTIAELSNGAVVLPDLDLSLDDAAWDELGRAGAKSDETPFARDDAITHPQFHLKLLLNRMGIARGEVQPWHRAGLGKGPPERSHAISSLFLPPESSKRWVDLEADKRRLAGVRVMESANPEEEAQAIALLMREALAVPEKRVALITNDRGLAGRVVAHLKRWNIEADDSAGRPLSQTAAGRVLLLLAEVMAERAAPVPLLALLTHPLVAVQDDSGRAAWLEHARTLEKALRGPRQEPGLAPLARFVAKDEAAQQWWRNATAALEPVVAFGEVAGARLADMIDTLSAAAEVLCGEAVWAQADGRTLAALVEELRAPAAETGFTLAPRDLPAMLRDAMDRVAVRPPWGGHPRAAIYGLIEARMSRADLVICGGLNEGNWPGTPRTDPLLAPAVLRALGIPGADFRIGLAAHDLAGALGAPEVVLSRARRDSEGPAIPSRFLLRVQALLGELFTPDDSPYRETRIPALARALDPAPDELPRYERPAPEPSAEQRSVALSPTALDRLRGDPYQFYASHILRLRKLDPLDAEPSPAWQGTVAHKVLERWHRERGDLHSIALEELHQMNGHPLMRALWQPRLLAALDWIGAAVEAQGAEGRQVVTVEAEGEMTIDGVKIVGRADRIDRLADGSLAVIDYKTGSPASAKMVEDGFALQLGLVGLMARDGGIAGLVGEPKAFEYWSLARAKDGSFGYVQSPVRTGRMTTGLGLEEFLPQTEEYLRDAIGKWITGTEPFVARLNPDLPVYSDYDQLMRLDEWQGRAAREEAAA